MSISGGNIQTPIAAAGAIFSVLIGFYKLLVTQKAIPAPQKGQFVSKMVDYAFILALVAMVIGFVIKPIDNAHTVVEKAPHSRITHDGTITGKRNKVKQSIATKDGQGSIQDNGNISGVDNSVEQSIEEKH